MSGQAQERQPAAYDPSGMAPVRFPGRHSPPSAAKRDGSMLNSGGHLDFTSLKRHLDSLRLPENLSSVCFKVLDALSELEPEERHEIDLDFFEERLPIHDKERLIPALTILGTMPEPILSVHSYLETEDGRVYLSNGELFDLIGSGKLNHPHTGEPVERPLKSVYLFYSVMEGAKP